MLSKCTLFSVLILTTLFAGQFSLAPLTSYAAAPESIAVKLEMNHYHLAEQGDGTTWITADGFKQYGAPGDPLLPGKSVQVALPPDVDLATVQFAVTPLKNEILPGQYTFPAAGPLVTWVDGREVVDWGPNRETIRFGRNQAVFESDDWFPQELVVLQDVPQMRKWLFARFWFSPVQIRPRTAEVRIHTAVEMTIHFQRRVVRDSRIDQALNDHAFDEQASRQFVNFAEATSWYEDYETDALTAVKSGLAIITTNQIVTSSARLEDYIAHKEAMGFRVILVTEDDFAGLSGQPPNGTAEKIRKWLIDHYLAETITDVLLIGNPPGDLGDIPMKECWAMKDRSYVLTDYYYADLTGNWNLDGDEYYCEYGDDAGPGGVDFAADVYVGRIPVYYVDNWENKLDRILDKIIFYENESEPSWRKSALLAMAFSDPSTDKAFLGEHMRLDYLIGNHFYVTTLYQQYIGSDCDSRFISDVRLTDRITGDLWEEGLFGVVAWSGHGGSEAAYLNCDEGVLFDKYDVASLDDAHPAFAFLGSCGNGAPNKIVNLGTELLKNGAIGTLSASHLSWYVRGEWMPGSSPDSSTIGYLFFESVTGEERAGKALYQLSINLHTSFEVWWHNLFTYNLYGDPTTRISEPYQFSLTAESEMEKADPGETASYTVQITNKGSAPDSYTIAATGLWPIETLSEVGPVEPGGDVSFEVAVTVPITALAGESDTAQIAVTSQGNAGMMEALALTTTASTVFAVSVSSHEAQMEALPGETISYVVKISNKGNVPESYTIAAAGIWPVETLSEVGPVHPGSDVSLDVAVTAPLTALAGESDTAQITVTSQGDAGISKEVALTTTAKAVFAMEISPTEAEMGDVPGASLTATLLIANQGNISDTYKIAVASGWPVAAPQLIGPLSPGQETAVELQIRIPDSASDGSIDEMVLTVTSTGDLGLHREANWRCIAVWPRIFLPVVR
jgi:uncharacterized membrane protein